VNVELGWFKALKAEEQTFLLFFALGRKEQNKIFCTEVLEQHMILKKKPILS